MTAFLTITGVVLLLWLINRGRAKSPRREAPKPSQVGEERLARELMKLTAELETVQRGSAERVTKTRQTLRAAWSREQLDRVPIECVEVEGVGARLVESLRDAGVRSLADLDKVEVISVPGVGAARADALKAAHASAWRKASADSARLSDAALDRWSNGQLAGAQLDDEHAAVARARKATALEVRIADLRQRAEAAGCTDIEVTMHQIAAQSSSVGRPRAPSAPTQARYRDDLKCPRCGSRLRRVTGRYGPFIGCTRYPRCSYTRNC